MVNKQKMITRVIRIKTHAAKWQTVLYQVQITKLKFHRLS